VAYTVSVADSPRIQELRRRVQQDPASLAFAPLAEELRRAGRLAEAIDICRRGLARHPEYLSGRATLGRALLDHGELEASLTELAAVLAAAPEHLAALKGVADIHARRGDTATALASYRQALALAREDPELTRAIADLEAILPNPEREAVVSREAASASGPEGPPAQPSTPLTRLETFLQRVLAARVRHH
jgi:tetratricopeptide (TPR) repeat protein